MVNKSLIPTLGIIFILLFSALAPMGLGYNNHVSNENIPQSTNSDDGGLMDSAWPMFHHDTHHTGISPNGKSGTWYMQKWNISIGSMVYSSPAIDKDGTIYIGSDYLNAINPDGTKKWDYRCGSVRSSPAIAEDGTIFVGSDDGRLYAIFPNGTLKWQLGIGSSWVYSSPVIDDDGIIYVACVGNNICAVYPNGTKKWDYYTGDMIYSSPVIDDDTVYCGSHDNYFYALYKNNGSLKWRLKSDAWCGGKGASIDDDGNIYFGTTGGNFYSLYPNGTLRWNKKIGSNVISSPAIDIDGDIIVAAYDSVNNWAANVYNFNPDGTVNWEYRYLTEVISTSPAIDKYGVIYLGTWDGYLFALNPDGTYRWSFKALDYIFSSPAIGEDGAIYFGTHTTDARLYAIEPIEGNSPPEKPSIFGPQHLEYYKKYTFTFSSDDPDGDDVCYWVDWDPWTSSGWTEFVQSGGSISLSYRWWKIDVNFLDLRAKAKDKGGAWSDWQEFRVYFKPRSRSIINWFSFLELFPILHKILDILFKIPHS